MKKVVTILLAVSLTIHASSLAQAHSSVAEFSPRKELTLTELPKKVSITFSEKPLSLDKKQVNVISVLNPEKVIISRGKTRVIANTLVITIDRADAISGRYRVIYRMASQDGHVISGSYRFTLRP